MLTLSTSRARVLPRTFISLRQASINTSLTGRRSGYSHGKGGSMHMFSREKNFFGGHGIVGAQVPIGTGLAFAHHYRGNGQISITYLGDGAINQGQVYESFNMAELWSLPVVYVIENNQYAMGTSVARSSSETHLFRRGASFNIPGAEVDGMDVVAVRDAGLAAAADAPGYPLTAGTAELRSAAAGWLARSLDAQVDPASVLPVIGLRNLSSRANPTGNPSGFHLGSF